MNKLQGNLRYPEGKFKILLDSTRLDSYAIGVVIPVFNASETILDVLAGVYSSLDLPSKIVIVIDASPDDSEVKVMNYINEKLVTENNPHDFAVLKTVKGLHETKCDNLGFRFLTAAKIFLEVQADIVIKEKNLASQLVNLFQTYPDIFAISGRGGHKQNLGYNPKLISLTTLYLLREIWNRLCDKHKTSFPNIYLDNSVETSKFFNTGEIGFLDSDFDGICDWKDKNLYITGTVMRGPLAFRAETLRKLGYLNFKSHPLASDDHEVNLRALEDFGQRSAFFAMKLETKLIWGSDRRKKPLAVEVANFLRYLQSIKYKRKSRLYISRHSSRSLEKYEIRTPL